MLILTRAPGEAICIEGGIRVVVLKSDGKNVRLGIEAPSHVTVLREEIVERIAEENRRAGLPADMRGMLGDLDGAEGEDPGPEPPAGDVSPDGGS